MVDDLWGGALIIDAELFVGMLVPRRDGKAVAIVAPDRPWLVPTFTDLKTLQDTMRHFDIPYDEVHTIEDGPAFVAHASDGFVGITVEEGCGGRVRCLVIEVARA